MQKYIDQLLEDIAAAKRTEQVKPLDTQPISLEEHFEKMECWLAGTPSHTFSYYCGLEPEQFPPAESLTDEQIDSVCKSVENLLFSWNLCAAFPQPMPMRIAYTLMIGILAEKVEIVDDGCVGIQFCTYDPPSCPFKEYCSCWQYLEDNGEVRDNGEAKNNGDDSIYF